MTDDDPAYAELRALKARLATLETMAAQPEGEPVRPTKSLAEAISAHYAAPPSASDHRRKLINEARGWSVDDQMEDAIKARDRDPAAWHASMQQMHASAGPLAFYERGKTASLALAALDAKEGTSNN